VWHVWAKPRRCAGFGWAGAGLADSAGKIWHWKFGTIWAKRLPLVLRHWPHVFRCGWLFLKACYAENYLHYDNL